MLGVDYDTSTYIHFVEVILWNEQLNQDTEAKYPALSRPALGVFWDRVGTLNRGLVGDADCRLFKIQRYLDTLVCEVKRNPALYVR